MGTKRRRQDSDEGEDSPDESVRPSKRRKGKSKSKSRGGQSPARSTRSNASKKGKKAKGRKGKSQEPSRKRGRSQPPADKDSLPPGWQSKTDPSQNNRVYYIHKATSTSTWTRPTLENCDELTKKKPKKKKTSSKKSKSRSRKVAAESDQNPSAGEERAKSAGRSKKEKGKKSERPQKNKKSERRPSLMTRKMQEVAREPSKARRKKSHAHSSNPNRGNVQECSNRIEESCKRVSKAYQTQAALQDAFFKKMKNTLEAHRRSLDQQKSSGNKENTKPLHARIAVLEKELQRLQYRCRDLEGIQEKHTALVESHKHLNRRHHDTTQDCERLRKELDEVKQHYERDESRRAGERLERFLELERQNKALEEKVALLQKKSAEHREELSLAQAQQRTTHEEKINQIYRDHSQVVAKLQVRNASLEALNRDPGTPSSKAQEPASSPHSALRKDEVDRRVGEHENSLLRRDIESLRASLEAKTTQNINLQKRLSIYQVLSGMTIEAQELLFQCRVENPTDKSGVTFSLIDKNDQSFHYGLKSWDAPSECPGFMQSDGYFDQAIAPFFIKNVMIHLFKNAQEESSSQNTLMESPS